MRRIRHPRRLYYSTREAAELLGLSERALRQQAARGEVPAVKLAAGEVKAKTHWRYPVEEIDRLAGNVTPLPAPALPSAAEIAREVVAALASGEFEVVLRPVAKGGEVRTIAR